MNNHNQVLIITYKQVLIIPNRRVFVKLVKWVLVNLLTVEKITSRDSLSIAYSYCNVVIMDTGITGSGRSAICPCETSL